MKNNMISCMRCILLLVATLGICLPSSHGATQAEVLHARRVRAFLVGQANISPTLVGPALRDVIEGRANDGNPIPGNIPDLQIAHQKDEIQTHARTHRHFGDNIALLNIVGLAIPEHFSNAPLYPSKFNIRGVPVTQNNATRTCNEIIDLLLSGMVSFEVGEMQALPPPAPVQLMHNPLRSSRFLLFANLNGHHIFGLGDPPCTFYREVTYHSSRISTYIQLVVGARTVIPHLAPQTTFISIFPAQNRSVNAPNALAPVRYPCLVRLKHCLYDNRERAIYSMIGGVMGGAIVFVLSCLYD